MPNKCTHGQALVEIPLWSHHQDSMSSSVSTSTSALSTVYSIMSTALESTISTESCLQHVYSIRVYSIISTESCLQHLQNHVYSIRVYSIYRIMPTASTESYLQNHVYSIYRILSTELCLQHRSLQYLQNHVYSISSTVSGGEQEMAPRINGQHVSTILSALAKHSNRAIKPENFDTIRSGAELTLILVRISNLEQQQTQLLHIHQATIKLVGNLIKGMHHDPIIPSLAPGDLWSPPLSSFSSSSPGSLDDENDDNPAPAPVVTIADLKEGGRRTRQQ